MGILEGMGLNIQRKNMEGIWRRLARKAIREISKTLIREIIATLIYLIWKARNGALWKKAVVMATKISKKTRNEINGRFMSRIDRAM